MSFFGRTASPVMSIQPQPAHQSPFGRPFFSHQSQPFGHPVSCSTQRPSLKSTSTFAGRKRSRDEAAVNLDEPEKAVPPPKIQEPEDEWEYGPGMVLIKKKTGYVADAATQSGTWVEEKAAQEHARKLVEAAIIQEKLSQERPSLRSHKSQRLDLTNTPVPSGQAPQTNGTNTGRDISPEAPPHPIVDDFTMHLGVGWARLSEDVHIQAAARGWARYIENHFPVNNAKIRLQKSHEAYLVEASEGFFLFAENLREGRLVSRDAQRALQNLRSYPAVFDGPTMTAVESPRPQLQDANTSTWNTTPSTVRQLPTVPDMDVDMS
ncbi:hypothetical protein VP1G_05326 [Cytospora mali]|uniref:Uncharacterized protein n=1 Tax=Cytospora mali TaxID=578113 RepID=A0A194V219_CYTMA|nr:hypothetical protein VP1G_05326 [Valsa mali var. pyri (nom. inval.)]